jgi:hypothetical protein
MKLIGSESYNVKLENSQAAKAGSAVPAAPQLLSNLESKLFSTKRLSLETGEVVDIEWRPYFRARSY